MLRPCIINLEEAQRPTSTYLHLLCFYLHPYFGLYLNIYRSSYLSIPSTYTCIYIYTLYTYTYICIEVIHVFTHLSKTVAQDLAAHPSRSRASFVSSTRVQVTTRASCIVWTCPAQAEVSYGGLSERSCYCLDPPTYTRIHTYMYMYIYMYMYMCCCCPSSPE